MESKEELLKIVKAAQAKLAKMDAVESLAANRALVGKCFKYPKNCYSCPEKPGDYWPVYYKVVSADSSGVKAMEFETDKYGDITINFKKWSHVQRLTPITNTEFLRAWKSIQRRIAACTT